MVVLQAYNQQHMPTLVREGPSQPTTARTVPNCSRLPVKQPFGVGVHSRNLGGRVRGGQVQCECGLIPESSDSLSDSAKSLQLEQAVQTVAKCMDLLKSGDLDSLLQYIPDDVLDQVCETVPPSHAPQPPTISATHAPRHLVYVPCPADDRNEEGKVTVSLPAKPNSCITAMHIQPQSSPQGALHLHAHTHVAH
jgi:hypothetical protein